VFRRNGGWCSPLPKFQHAQSEAGSEPPHVVQDSIRYKVVSDTREQPSQVCTHGFMSMSELSFLIRVGRHFFWIGIEEMSCASLSILLFSCHHRLFTLPRLPLLVVVPTFVRSIWCARELWRGGLSLWSQSPSGPLVLLLIGQFVIHIGLEISRR